jgi:hypothetical protein
LEKEKASIKSFVYRHEELLPRKSLVSYLTPIQRLLNRKSQRPFGSFSYACNGMNIKDIALLKFKHIHNEIKYYRAKTVNTKKGNLKEIIVYLNDYTKNIIQKYNVGNQDLSSIYSIVSKIVICC